MYLREPISMTSIFIAGSSRYVKRMVTLGRFELPTSGLGNRCSIHLRYRATFFQSRSYRFSPMESHIGAIEASKQINLDALSSPRFFTAKAGLERSRSG